MEINAVEKNKGERVVGILDRELQQCLTKNTDFE